MCVSGLSVKITFSSILPSHEQHNLLSALFGKMNQDDNFTCLCHNELFSSTC